MSSTGDHTLAVEGLTKRYGDTVALDGVDLTVEEGEFVAVVGPSGCGKSTLLRVLSGLEEHFEGRAAVDGVDVRDGGSDAVGMVFQEPRLLAWADVRENVAVGLPSGVDRGDAAARDRVDDLIETVGLDGFAGSRPSELSGGMAQRVSLARGLAYRPEVLLLDEPFSALDQLTKYEQQDNLLEVWAEQGTTIALVTHDVEEAAYLADRVVVLGGQPGTVETVVDVDAPRPRDRTDPELLAARDAITDALGL
ncbi:NitT/TauT family transport system ATP-binding protein/sulfonate transport system ATP-binding protein [Halorubrum alkaliphilum]|uniref:NitT/TauT family transport system ATP-binding protein/sulfonate transport system ATP-binding protein n=1 Tax=Halorubrum alkaliphilum TaxID=261290 RepID=A0A8T4GDA2_9EURY|nr:ABC transporter ATP-binding protein [Halorubrum alkaliphilum]MBP1922464.1 NitT/TauT family transport system ATP-binding protein/sulfonate transport system ATP-binding protein [Halorubrum alkaliphilum]